MTNEEFYALLNQAGHRLGDLAKSSQGYTHELRKLIEIVQEQLKDGHMLPRGTNPAGEAVYGTMQEVLDDYKRAASAEARLANECLCEIERLRTENDMLRFNNQQLMKSKRKDETN